MEMDGKNKKQQYTKTGDKLCAILLLVNEVLLWYNEVTAKIYFSTLKWCSKNKFEKYFNYGIDKYISIIYTMYIVVK